MLGGSAFWDGRHNHPPPTVKETSRPMTHLPAPYSMCSPSEASDRQNHMELSELESTHTSYALGPRQRVHNPCLVVKKYRRSAAGGGVSRPGDDAAGRSVSSLAGTIDYLLGTLLPSQSAYAPDVMPPRPLANIASFVDDRVRAVQVELITSLSDSVGIRSEEDWAAIRRTQSRLVRYGILAPYLLSGLPPARYEASFGKTALRTAIDAYFAAWEASFGNFHGNASGEERAVRDEMMSYEALMHVAAALRDGEDQLPARAGRVGERRSGGAGAGALLASFLARGGADQTVPNLVEEGGGVGRWATALEVAAAAEGGNLLRVFRLLSCDRVSMGSEEDRRWGVLARCCLVPALNAIRIGLARRYNKSLGKGEKVSADDLARLLLLPSAVDAICFCSDIGLPTVASMEGGPTDRIVMKSAPISLDGADRAVTSRMGSPGREEDAFVFGRDAMDGWVSRPSSLHMALSKSKDCVPAAVTARGSSGKGSRWGDDSESDEDDWLKPSNNDIGTDVESPSRIDQDGVFLPPGKTIWNIIC